MPTLVAVVECPERLAPFWCPLPQENVQQWIRVIPEIVLFGVIQTVGFAALLEGLVSGEASILVPIAQLSFVVTALIGIAFLKESLTARKTAGLLAAVAAVGVLAMAARQ